MNNCCDNSFYRTAYNKNYQNVYCNLAQSAKTNLQNVVTSGWSMNKQIRENYCGCGLSKVYLNTPMVEGYEKPYKFSISNTGKMVKENYETECKTDFLRTPFDIQYQNLYCNMAQKGRSTISGNFSYNP